MSSAKIVLKWTDALECQLLHLWSQSEKKKSEKKMLTKKSQHAWAVRKLTIFAEENNLDLAGLTVSAVKNKLAGVKKKGKALVEKLIKPFVRAAMTPLLTGSEAPDDGEPPADPLSTFDWQTLEKRAKWSNFHVYFNLFGGHPTWGLSSTGETGSDSEAERESQEHTPSGLSATRSSSASGCAAATSSTGKRGNPQPIQDGDSDDDEFGGLATSDAPDDHDDSQAVSTAVTTVNAVKRPSAGATHGSSDAPSKKTRVDEASSTLSKRGQPAKPDFVVETRRVKAGPPLEAILVIFGRRALIFFV